MTSQEAYKFSLLILAVWREARGEPLEAKIAVANVIKNRVNSSKFKQWGLGWDGVILHPFQFSSFNKPVKDPATGKWVCDPNAASIPALGDPAVPDSIKAAEMVFNGNAIDNTGGATYYYDSSLDKPGPKGEEQRPKWALDGSMVRTADIGAFHFYRG